MIYTKKHKIKLVSLDSPNFQTEPPNPPNFQTEPELPLQLNLAQL